MAVKSPGDELAKALSLLKRFYMALRPTIDNQVAESNAVWRDCRKWLIERGDVDSGDI